MLLIVAGLVIGAVIFMLIVSHSKPDESEFTRHFKEAAEQFRQQSEISGSLELPVLKMRRRDFRGTYTGREALDRWPGDIEVDGELGEVGISGDLNITGTLRIAAGTVLRVEGDVSTGGPIYVAGILISHKSIYCNQSIHCGDTVEAGGSIHAAANIGAGRVIQAAARISAGGDIRAGVQVKAGDSVNAEGTIESPIVIAGREGEPRTVRCSRLIRGRVSLGELVETGKPG